MAYKRISIFYFIALGLVFILIGLCLSISFGANQIPLTDIINAFFHQDPNNVNAQIIKDIRLPRAICAILIGCFLATSGAVIQGITANPIASPSIMGVTQGAALAVSIFMAFQPVPGPMGKVFCGFIGASISAIFIFILSMKKSSMNVNRMILAGASLGTLFISLASMIALLTNNTKNLGFWIAGSLSATNWTSVIVLAIVSVFILFFVIRLSPNIMILSLGDETAVGLGQNPNKIRLLSLMVVVVLSGTSAAVGGNIGFVCLIVPHIVRLCVGTDYKRIIPVCMIFGGVLLLYSDILARVLASPFEVPVGSITSLIGVPVLVYLVRRGGRA